METTEVVPVPLIDLGPETGSFRTGVIEGLRQAPKTIPCKYLYDEHGSELFDRICDLEVYYPTRTEIGIMQAHANEMAACIGARALVIEYGSGASLKTRLLLDALHAPAGYVPIDISREHLRKAARRLSGIYPKLPVRPVCADYTSDVSLPSLGVDALRTLVYFPGSTIGNFDPPEARRFLGRMATMAGLNGALLIGVDLKKDRATLEAAYNDPQGVTAAFNKNVLRRANRELDADFDLDAFVHRAPYDAKRGCVEMHLVSSAPQEVHIGDVTISFDEGESIRTERSYKYAPNEFAALTAQAGLVTDKIWIDDAGLFSIQLMRREERESG